MLQLKDPNVDPSEFYVKQELTTDDEMETDDENINRGNFCIFHPKINCDANTHCE